jgi:toxin FitB
LTYLLDTVAASEFTKLRPNGGLVGFLSSVDEDDLYLSVATLSEIRYGVELLPTGGRRKTLMNWLTHELPARFDGRIVPVSAEIADEWGRVSAQRRAKGRAIDAMDALIAATANLLNLTIVTRNTGDFDGFTDKVHNPWT